jgi:hypothetical protein
MVLFRPLIHWSTDTVFAFARAHGMSPNPLYLQGMGRVGCFPCINAGKEELAAIGQRHPWAIDRLLEYEAAVLRENPPKHMEGTAFDIAMSKYDPVAFEAAAREVGFLGFGFYPRSGFMHIDLGPARQWGVRFPVRAVSFAVETAPAREVLAQSRTLRGTGAAGVATVGTAGVEVAQEVLVEAQSAVLPVVPYLDTLRWLFIALALGGIAVAIWARLDDWRRGLR